MAATKKKTLWVARIPGIFGYGIAVVETTQGRAIRALVKEYEAWKVARPDDSTCFKTSYEYWGGYVTQVEIGKGYHDTFCG
jgi:hypothetical protein